MKWTSLLNKVNFHAPGSSPRRNAAPSDAPFKQQNSQESEQDFKKYWEDFRCAHTEKEKQEALETAVDVFCKLSRREERPAQLVLALVDVKQFAFVVGRAFISDVDKLKLNGNLARDLVQCCDEKQEEGSVCSNLLCVLENLVCPPLDVQPLLDAGLLSCLVQVLYSFLRFHDIPHDLGNARFEVEARVVHILKALGQHPGAAQSLCDDDSLQLLFNMVVTEPSEPAHVAQLHRHVLQILGNLLSGDDGTCAKYIHKYQLIKLLLRPLKEFAKDGDGTYTVNVVSLLVACVQLSYKRGSGGINLREDLQNAHGYQLLVQFALFLSGSPTDRASSSGSTSLKRLLSLDEGGGSAHAESELSTSLLAVLDMLIELAQVGAVEDAEPGDSNYNKAKAEAIQSRCFPVFDGTRRTETTVTDGKVRDVFAMQVLQDIFLKSVNLSLQLEVLDRLLRLLSSHPDNYLVLRDLRTLPLFILNMPTFSQVLQLQLLKVLEYVVTVSNHVPEQELLSLCCLLQQHVDNSLRRRIISCFVKLLSFDQQYKKVLREVGVLDVLIEDLKKCRVSLKAAAREVSDIALIFEDQTTIEEAWQCLLSLLKKNDTNQATFRKSGAFDSVLPFLATNIHRPGALRTLCCLIGEDTTKTHSEELGSLIDIVATSTVTTSSGDQFTVDTAVKADVLWAIWRILLSNSGMKDLFSELKGFTLLFGVLQNFEPGDSLTKMEMFNPLLHVMTVAVAGHSGNRSRLNEMMLSDSFSENLVGWLLPGEYEELILELFFDLSLERVQFPARKVKDRATCSSGPENSEEYSRVVLHDEKLEISEVHNAGIIRVIFRHFDGFSSKAQLKALTCVEALSRKSLHNRDRLTSAGCLECLLSILLPNANHSSIIWMHGMQIVKSLGTYRISSSELRTMLRYMWQCRDYSYGQVSHRYIEALEGMVHNEETMSENLPVSSFLDFTLRKAGYAGVRIGLGDRSWPPATGYSFACWVRYTGLDSKESKKPSKPRNPSAALRLFTVETAEEEPTPLAEFYMDYSGVLTLSTASKHSFKGVRLEEGLWYHLVLVQNKPNVLAGLFQSSVASVYVNGSLRYTGKLGYSPASAGKTIQAVLGFPPQLQDVCSLTWQVTGCYLFEDVLSASAICLLYALGRGYRGLFQDTDLLRFVPYEACGGGNLSILEALESVSAGSAPKGEFGRSKADGSGAVWELERLITCWTQLSSKRLIFAFDGTPGQTQLSAQQSIVNLVEPLSAAASPFGGLPRIGRLFGDVETLAPWSFGSSIRKIGGVAVVLALVEAAETTEMLHLALSLLLRVLQYNPHNAYEMLACRGYHLLALFLHRRIALFDLQDLELLFQMTACEASFFVPQVATQPPIAKLSGRSTIEAHVESDSLSAIPDDQASSAGSMFDAVEDISTGMSELGTAITPEESLNCVVLSNPDMMEHVLLDWTIWTRASVTVQLSLLGFIERLVAVHRYRNHNLTTLRRLNLVQHLLVTLQRGDIEVPVIEKLVVLLGILLEDGFVPSELKYVADFVVMSFHPPELSRTAPFSREPMGVQVIVRKILLEMLIDLQMTINSEETLETWHKFVSSRIITFVLDEAAHPTTMGWVMTLFAVCVSSSATFSAKFQASGGYQALTRVLTHFYDAPDIFYILFCLMFGKPVYPRQPEVRLLDFHALMPNDGTAGEVLFTDLLDSVLSMFKAAFDKMSLQSQLVQRTGDFSLFPESLAAGFANAFKDAEGDLQGEALLHKTYAARLMGGEAAAPALVTSLLRFMVDLAKMYHPFAAACRRQDFLEASVDLYFSCARSAAAVQAAQGVSAEANDQLSYVFSDDFQVVNSISGRKKEEIYEPTDEEVQLMAVADEPKTTSLDVNRSLSQAIPERSFGSPFTYPAAYGEEDNHSHLSSSFPNNYLDSTNSAFVTLPLSPSGSDLSRNGTAVAGTSFTSGGFSSWIKSSFPSEGTTPAPSRTGSSIPSRTTSVSSATPFGIAAADSTAKDDKLAFPVTKRLLWQLEAAGSGGGPCSAGATSVLDFIAEVLADALTEQPKATGLVELVLEAVPLHVTAEAALVFQGLCLCRVMIFLERRLLRDDEETHKKLDKARWSPNLDAFSSLLVDRVFMGAFGDPGTVLKVLEFLLSMLQLANKHGRVEEGMAGRGLLSLARGGFRQVEPFVQSLLRNVNRIILYCFLPSNEYNAPEAGGRTKGTDITSMLQLLLANKKLILCPSNIDLEFLQCLLVNIIPMLQDQKQNARTLAVDVCKALLLYRKEALQDILVIRQIPGDLLDAFNGGFDRLLSNNTIGFFTWFDDAHDLLRRVLDQRASVTWMGFIDAAAKFSNARLKSSEARRKRDVGKREKEALKAEGRHMEVVLERRVALEVVRDSLAAELRIMRQVKYGWVIHAENEWQDHIQQLVHERGLWPVVPEGGQEWQLCSTEGPYRMRKKLVRCKPKIDMAGKAVREPEADVGEDQLTGQTGFAVNIEDPDYDTFFHIFSLGAESPKGKPDSTKDYMECFDEDDIESKGRDDSNSTSTRGGGAADQQSTVSEGGKSAGSVRRSKSGETQHSLARSQAEADAPLVEEASSDPDFEDDGEYLITPYLERGEKIRFRYNCERVAGLDKRDGIFLIGEKCLYVIENYFIDKNNRICEKGGEGDLSVIDQALGVKSSASVLHGSTQTPIWSNEGNAWPGGKAWAYSGGAWGKETISSGRHMSHSWHMWKLDSVHELLKRWYQLRPVAIELFSLDGCNDLLVFHKEERDEVFKNLLSMNLPRTTRLETAISGVSKQDAGEGGRLFKTMAKSFSKRWQNGEISNFQYLMHLNTLAGRGYNDLTQYPVFPWVIADYESEELNLSNPTVYRRLDKPMGALSLEREDLFRKRYENWDDPEIPKFHYGSHYSSAGTVLFYMIRLPPFSQENLKLQGGQFDHADRLFTSIRDTWMSASQGSTADVKELIPEFYYLPEFLENRFDLDLGVKQSGEKVDDVALPPWAGGSAREFIRKHREALESQYVSENLHHWIDLIFGYRQKGQAAVDATNVFYYLTYEGAVDIDSVRDPALKAATLSQINHFGQTPRQLFLKPHPRRKCHQKVPFGHVLRSSQLLTPQEVRNATIRISQIVVSNDKVYSVGHNRLLKPRSFSKYIAWGFPDHSLRFFTYDQDRLLSTHEGLHDGNIHCAAFSTDGKVLVTGGEDGIVSVWRLRKDGVRSQRRLHPQRSLLAHTDSITCLSVCQAYSLVVSGSKDCTVIFWDLSSLEFVKQLPELPAAASAVHINDRTGEVVTAAGTFLAVWSINGDCLAALNTSRLASDTILSIVAPVLSDWMETGWYVTGHQNGAVKLWKVDYNSWEAASRRPRRARAAAAAAAAAEVEQQRCLTVGTPESQLVLHRVLKYHTQPVTALHLTPDLRQLHSGDAGGHITSWVLSDGSPHQQPECCPWCQDVLDVAELKHYCRNCGRFSCSACGGLVVLPELGYLEPVRVCRGCYQQQQPH